MYKVALTVAVALTVLGLATAKRFCTSDAQCSSLGALTCQFSMCKDKGVCGCARNHVAKWMGSGMLYQCVPLRKVGQGCSNFELTGTCGAPNSYCDDKEGRCVCPENTVADFAGEKCEAESSQFSNFIEGETCVQSSTCSSSTCTSMPSGSWYYPVYNGPRTCACTDSEKLELVYDETTPFPDRLIPKCISRVVGDMCEKDTDCPSNSECSSSKTCVCPTLYTKNYMGDGCILNTLLLSLNGNCSGTRNSLCDGTKGLVCGNMCEWYQTDSAHLCSCGPSHKLVGGACQAYAMGDACFGDMNCRATNMLGICVGGICVDGNTDIPASITAYDDEHNAGKVLTASLSLLGLATYLAL